MYVCVCGTHSKSWHRRISFTFRILLKKSIYFTTPKWQQRKMIRRKKKSRARKTRIKRIMFTCFAMNGSGKMSKGTVQVPCSKNNEWKIIDAICAKQWWCTNYKMGHEFHWRSEDSMKCYVAPHPMLNIFRHMHNYFNWKRTRPEEMKANVCMYVRACASESVSLSLFVYTCIKRMLCFAMHRGKCENYTIKQHHQNMHDRIYRPPKTNFYPFKWIM